MSGCGWPKQKQSIAIDEKTAYCIGKRNKNICALLRDITDCRAIPQKNYQKVYMLRVKTERLEKGDLGHTLYKDCI